MPRTLHLHIGLPKTASTFLQNQVFSGLSQMRTRIMPQNEYFADRDTRLLESIFSRSETIWRSDADPILTELLGAGWETDDRDILVSDEAIGRKMSRQSLCAGHLAALKSAVMERGIDRVRVVCLIRRQDHWLASHYVQVSDRAQNPGQADFERVVDEILDPRDQRYTFGALLDFHAIYDALIEAVGPEDVLMLPMEWLGQEPDAFAARLADWLDLQQGSLRLEQRENQNVRRSGKTTWQLRNSGWNDRLQTMLRGSAASIELTPELSRKILIGYARSNRNFAEKTAMDLAPLGYFAHEEQHRSREPEAVLGQAPA